MNNQIARWKEKQFKSVDHVKCYYCQKLLTRTTMTADHIVAKSRGGTDAKMNLVPACFRCNQSKCDMSVPEWLNELQQSSNQMFILAIKELLYLLKLRGVHCLHMITNVKNADILLNYFNKYQQRLKRNVLNVNV